MSEENAPKPIRKADLARHWNVTSAYITKLVKKSGLPIRPDGKVGFADFEAADNWRAVNAPPKAAKSSPGPTPRSADSMENLDSATEKIAPTDTTTTTTDKKAAEGESGTGVTEKIAGGKSLPANTAQSGAEIIDVTKFIRRNVDFDALMIQQAEGVPQVAHGLYERACNGGNPTEIAASLKNWHEASKAAAAVREKFLEIQERMRALLPLDEVMDIVGTELQQARTALIKLGERCAAAANPQNPALAQRVIDAATDGVFRQFDGTTARAAKELTG